jgi:class 3 adenylate cyclase
MKNDWDNRTGKLPKEEHSHHELERRIFHLKTLYDVSQDIGQLKDTETILKNLLMMMVGTFGVLKGVIVIVDIKEDRINTLSQRGMPKVFIDKLSMAVKSGYFRDMKEITDVRILTGADGIQSEQRNKIIDLLCMSRINIWIPFAVNDQLIGGIGLGDKLSGDNYSSDDSELLSTLSHQGAMCLQRAKLIEQLEKRVYHLKTLYDVSQDVGFLRIKEDIMKSLLMMIIGTFGVMKGFIVLVDVTKNNIEAVTKRGMGKPFIDKLSKIVRSGQFAELNEIQVLTEENKGAAEIELFLSDIKVWLPYTVNENLKGGIGLGHKLSGDAYTPDDLELLSTLTGQGAVALQNSNLVDQMKKEEIVRTNLSRYLSPQIVDRVINNDVHLNLGGNRKAVTILFSDIRDFTTISETMPADQLVHILNEYFTAMAEIIFECQGSLDKYIGDAIVAVFGSLIPLENPAHNAVEASIQMMKRLPVLNEQWAQKYGFSMEIGIGVNTGEVFLGNIGSPERMEFTVIGDTVNVASRFSGLARAGQILMTAETLSTLDNAFDYVALPPSEVKGKSGKLEVFEITYTPPHRPQSG